MKKQFVITLLMSIFSLSNIMLENEPQAEKIVTATIIKFAGAADAQDAEVLDAVLDNSFRLVLNQMFGSKELAFVDKQTYLNKIKAKEFGGDKREVKIAHLTIVNNNASAQATFKGSKMTVVTMLQLVKTNEGTWKIINDLPSIL